MWRQAGDLGVLLPGAGSADAPTTKLTIGSGKLDSASEAASKNRPAQFLLPTVEAQKHNTCAGGTIRTVESPS